MAEFRDRYDEFRALNVEIAALATDTPAQSAAMRAEFRLPYVLLCDVDKQAIQAWDRINRLERGGIAKPTVAIVGQDRTLLYVSRDNEFTRVSAPEALAVLRALPGRAPHHTESTPLQTAPPRRRFMMPSPRQLAIALRNFFK